MGGRVRRGPTRDEARLGDALIQEGSSPEAENTSGVGSDDSGAPAVHRARGGIAEGGARREPGSSMAHPCVVHGCGGAANLARRFFYGGGRVMLCEAHLRASQVALEPGDELLRACFYCHRLHPLDAFDPGARTVCREKNKLRLAARKRKAANADVARRPAKHPVATAEPGKAAVHKLFNEQAMLSTGFDVQQANAPAGVLNPTADPALGATWEDAPEGWLQEVYDLQLLETMWENGAAGDKWENTHGRFEEANDVHMVDTRLQHALSSADPALNLLGMLPPVPLDTNHGGAAARATETPMLASHVAQAANPHAASPPCIGPGYPFDVSMWGTNATPIVSGGAAVSISEVPQSHHVGAPLGGRTVPRNGSVGHASRQAGEESSQERSIGEGLPRVTEEDLPIVMETLSNLKLHSSLHNIRGCVRAIAKEMRVMEFSVGQSLVQKGAHGSTFFIVGSGVFFKSTQAQAEHAEPPTGESWRKVAPILDVLGRNDVAGAEALRTGHRSVRGDEDLFYLSAMRDNADSLYPGDTFGEVDLVQETVCQATLVAGAPARVFAIERARVQAIVERKVEEALSRCRSALGSVPLFVHFLSGVQMDALSRALWRTCWVHADSGEFLMKPGFSSYCLLLEGSATVGRRRFCAPSLLGGFISHEMQLMAPAKAEGAVDALLIPESLFERAVGAADDVMPAASMQAFLKSMQAKASAKPKTEAKSRLSASPARASSDGAQQDQGASGVPIAESDNMPPSEQKQLALESFTLLRRCNRGRMTDIFVAKDEDGETVLLKVVSKAQGDVARFRSERRVISRVQGNSSIVRLLGTYENNTALYTVLEFVPCGQLSALLASNGSPSVPTARFLAANVVLGLAWIHKQGYVYRDLKPENLLVAANGYLKISDFRFAKHLEPGERAYTMCGTPEYLSPEMLEHLGCDSAADLWAFGILLFELLAGFVPFRGRSFLDLYHKIVASRQVCFPCGFDADARDLVTELLRKDEVHRIGVRAGVVQVTALKAHPFFQAIDWSALERGTLEAPFSPRRTDIAPGPDEVAL